MTEMDSKAHWLAIRESLPDKPIMLGPAYSNLYRTDPRALAFGAARYKFAAKMMAGVGAVFEVGCGDGFGAPIVAQAVDALICTDVDETQLVDNIKRLSTLEKIKFRHHDFRQAPLIGTFGGAFMLDVFEHIFPHEAPAFLQNVVDSIADDGVLVVGVPNKTAAAYACDRSRDGHVNLMTAEELKATLSVHFRRVFMFGMNDEVMHTGYAAMSHYLLAVATMKRPLQGLAGTCDACQHQSTCRRYGCLRADLSGLA